MRLFFFQGLRAYSKTQVRKPTKLMAMSRMEQYIETCDKLREIDKLEGISGVLGWDEMVMLPPEASGSRSEQKSTLTGIIYDKKTDHRLGDLLKSLGKAPPGTFDSMQTAVIRDALKQYNRSAALPRELATRISELSTEGYNAWVEARTKSDFSIFAPILKEYFPHHLHVFLLLLLLIALVPPILAISPKRATCYVVAPL